MCRRKCITGKLIGAQDRAQRGLVCEMISAHAYEWGTRQEEKCWPESDCKICVCVLSDSRVRASLSRYESDVETTQRVRRGSMSCRVMIYGSRVMGGRQTKTILSANKASNR